MTMTEITQLISNVGFPIAIALYVLVRLESTLKDNTKVIKELCIKINEMKK